MPVTAEQVATLRAYLVGDRARYEQLYEQLEKGSLSGYLALIDAAFFKAADRRFAKGSTNADIIEFVGTIRSRSDGLSEKVDPLAAERLIKAVLGDGSIDDLDDRIRFGTEIVLLAGLIIDGHLDDAGLDRFLVESRSLADEWLRADE